MTLKRYKAQQRMNCELPNKQRLLSSLWVEYRTTRSCHSLVECQTYDVMLNTTSAQHKKRQS